MFILSRRNIILSTVSGDETLQVKAGWLGEVPDRFCNTPYFRALVKDGKISVPQSTREKDVAAAADDGDRTLEDTVKKTRKAKSKE